MTIQPLQLFVPQQLTGAVATYYTSSGGFLTRIDKLTFTNQDAANPHNVTVYLVPNGGTAGVTNRIIIAFPIVASGTYTPPEVVGQILGAGGTLQMFADTTAQVTFFGAGTMISPT